MSLNVVQHLCVIVQYGQTPAVENVVMICNKALLSRTQDLQLLKL